MQFSLNNCWYKHNLLIPAQLPTGYHQGSFAHEEYVPLLICGHINAWRSAPLPKGESTAASSIRIATLSPPVLLIWLEELRLLRFKGLRKCSHSVVSGVNKPNNSDGWILHSFPNWNRWEGSQRSLWKFDNAQLAVSLPACVQPPRNKHWLISGLIEEV